MKIEDKLGNGFDEILNRFSDFIKCDILKYNLYRYGLDPDDISQDVKIKIWKLFKSEKNISNYSSYIRKIVRSSVIDQIRKFKREELIHIHEKKKHIAEQNQAYNKELTRFKSMEEHVLRAVDSLIETRRQVVKLYLLNLSILEISAYLGWSPDRTRNLLYRGLADLRKNLKQIENRAKDEY